LGSRIVRIARSKKWRESHTTISSKRCSARFSLWLFLIVPSSCLDDISVPGRCSAGVPPTVAAAPKHTYIRRVWTDSRISNLYHQNTT